MHGKARLQLGALQRFTEQKKARQQAESVHFFRRNRVAVYGKRKLSQAGKSETFANTGFIEAGGQQVVSDQGKIRRVLQSKWEHDVAFRAGRERCIERYATRTPILASICRTSCISLSISLPTA